MKKLNEKVNTFKYKVRTLTLWTALKWILIVAFVSYVGFSVARDVVCLRVNFSIYYSSNGLLSPVVK